MGRPLGSGLIYKEARRGVMIYFGNDLLKNLDEIAKKNNLSRIEYINSLVVQGDSERALLLAKTYHGLKEQISLIIQDKKNEDKKYYDCIKKLNRFVTSTLMEDVYQKIEPDERCKNIFGKFKPKLDELKAKNADFPNKEQCEYWTELIFNEVRDITLDDGMRIKKPAIIKDIIKKMLLEFTKTKK